MPKRKKLAPWIFGDGPEPVSVGLTVDQKRDIAASVGIALSAQDWKTIERARQEYTLAQWTKHQAVERKHLEKRMKNLIHDSNALLRSIRIDKPGIIAWANYQMARTYLSCPAT